MIELNKIQSELVANKGQYNKFGKYAYRSAEDILEALKPLLSKYECTLTISDEIISVLDRVYIKATATIKNKEDSTESTTALAREPQTQKGMNEAQITGSASSYARKYALNGLFAIDDNKDPDATNKHDDKPAVEPFAVKNERFKRELKLANIPVEDFYKVLDIKESNLDNVIANQEKLCKGYDYLLGKKIKNVSNFLKETGIDLFTVTGIKIKESVESYIIMEKNV